MKKIFFSLLFAVGYFANSTAQVPHLSGNIEISVRGGTIDADLQLSNLPKTDNYSLWLNAGLNVARFRSGDDRFNHGFEMEYLPNLSYEAMQYYFPANDNKSRYLPKSLRVKYTGKFPIFDDTLRASEWDDWKGRIAFNGKTLRASEQTAWYPILYDRNGDIVTDKYTFELTVTCKDCKTIYLNGDLPKQTTSATFSSDVPVSLMIFAGDYDFTKFEDIYLLNADLNTDKQRTLSRTTADIIHFYEKKLKLPYGKPVVYLSTTPTSKRNEWMFVTYPTIAVVGVKDYKLEAYFDDRTFEFKQKSNITFMAHELAHYYIGTVFVPNSTLRWFFLEGLTDYLSIQFAREQLGEEVYTQILNNYTENITDFTPPQFDSLKVANAVNETARYRYVPLLLTAIEREIGQKRMWEWINLVLQSKNATTDFDFLKNTLLQAGVKETEWQRIYEKYFAADDAKAQVLATAKSNIKK